MGCCNSAVSALKEQLFFSGMQYMKREKGSFLWSRYLENSSSFLDMVKKLHFSRNNFRLFSTAKITLGVAH
jgi:hypothetical protein